MEDKFSDELWKSIENNDDIWGRIIVLDNEKFRKKNKTLRIMVSLLSKKMRECDYNFFMELTEEVYRPYFCDFFGKISKDELPSNWEGKWLKVKVLPEKPKTDNEKSIFSEGTLVFSASPIRRKGRYLAFEKEAAMVKSEEKKSFVNMEKFINHFENKHGIKQRVKEKLVNLIKGEELHSDIYNVGQGNFVSFGNKNSDGIVLLDVGESVVKLDDKDPRFKHYFENLKPTLIILTHWDLDHILGVVNLYDKIIYGDNCTWIAPKLSELPYENVSESAYRLCAYLIKENVDLGQFSSWGEKILEACENEITVSLWQGEGRKGTFTLQNNIGLIMRVERKNDYVALFPGDCEYNLMPNELKLIKNTVYDFLLASHHGAYQERGDIRGSHEGTPCVFCYGKGNQYNHPSGDLIIDLLENDFWPIPIKKYSKIRVNFFATGMLEENSVLTIGILR